MARTWPAVTVSPGATLTAVTVPDEPKVSSLTVDDATDPETLTLLTTVPVDALGVTRAVGVVAERVDDPDRRDGDDQRDDRDDQPASPSAALDRLVEGVVELEVVDPAGRRVRRLERSGCRRVSNGSCVCHARDHRRGV